MMNIETRKRLAATIADAKEEEKYGKEPYYQLADYWQRAHKKHKFIVTPANWEKSKVIAKQFLEQNDGVSLEELYGCIDWAYSPARMKHSFWYKVTIHHLGTVLKMFNDYRQHAQVHNMPVQSEADSVVRRRRRFSTYKQEDME